MATLIYNTLSPPLYTLLSLSLCHNYKQPENPQTQHVYTLLHSVCQRLYPVFLQPLVGSVFPTGQGC